MQVFAYCYVIELPTPPTRKTKQWELRAKQGDVVLGFVEWFGRWRKYAFRPITSCSTWFEPTCLRQIADFIEAETKAHNAAKRAERNGKAD